jgi:uncharacterized OB-fold protein
VKGMKAKKVVYAKCDKCGYTWATELICSVCDNPAVTVSTEKKPKNLKTIQRRRLT